MPTIRFLPSDQRVDDPTIFLTIKKSFCSDRFSYKFSMNEHLIDGTNNILKVKLIADWSLGKRFKIQIHEHCCTRPDSMRRFMNGKPQDPPNYGAGLMEVAYQFTLEKRELVQIGVIVRVMKDNKYFGDLLCDPQVGNGPPAGSGFTSVSLMNLGLNK